MAAQRRLDAIQESLTCSICMEAFNADDLKPLSLPCTHSFCAQCIGQLRKSECPTCRAKVSGKGALPVNIDLMRIVNVLSAEDANETHFVCASHAKRGKSYFCLECWAVCCADCIIFGGHRKHDVQRADSISGALLDTIRDQARVVLADSSGLRDGLQMAAKSMQEKGCSIRGSVELSSTSTQLRCKMVSDRKVITHDSSPILCPISGKQYTTWKDQWDAIRQLLTNLKRHAERGALLEKDRLEDLACEMQREMDALQKAVDSGNSRAILCLLPPTRARLKHLSSRWSVPRVNFECLDKKGEPMTGSNGSSEECFNKAQNTQEKMPRVVCAEPDESHCSRQGVRAEDMDDDLPIVKRFSKESVAMGTPLRRSPRKRTASPSADQGPVKSKKKRENIALAKTTEDMRIVSTAVLTFISKHGLKGRFPVLCIGNYRNTAFMKPSGVAFGLDRSILVADCLNDRIAIFKMLPSSKMGGQQITPSMEWEYAAMEQAQTSVLTPINVSVCPDTGMTAMITRKRLFLAKMQDLLTNMQDPHYSQCRGFAMRSEEREGREKVPIMMAFDPARDTTVFVVKVETDSHESTHAGQASAYHLHMTQADCGKHVEVVLGFVPGGVAFDPNGNVIVTTKSDGYKVMRDILDECWMKTAEVKTAEVMGRNSTFDLTNTSQFTVAIHRLSFGKVSSNPPRHASELFYAEKDFCSYSPLVWKTMRLEPRECSDEKWVTLYELAQPILIQKGTSFKFRVDSVPIPSRLRKWPQPHHLLELKLTTDPNQVPVVNSVHYRVHDGRQGYPCLVFSTHGHCIAQFSAFGRGNGGTLCSPTSVTVDKHGIIFISDTGNNRIQIFRPDYSFLTSIGEEGTLPGHFKGPMGIAVMDRNGEHLLAVADCLNNRVQVFDLDALICTQPASFDRAEHRHSLPATPTSAGREHAVAPRDTSPDPEDLKRRVAILEQQREAELAELRRRIEELEAGCKEMPAGDVAGGALGLQHRALLARVASDAPEAGR